MRFTWKIQNTSDKGKLSPKFEPVPYNVIDKNKGEVTVEKDGVVYRRAPRFVKPVVNNDSVRVNNDNVHVNNDSVHINNDNVHVNNDNVNGNVKSSNSSELYKFKQDVQNQIPVRCNPKRKIKPATIFKYYVWN